MNTKMKKLTTAAICLALCLVLPFLTGQIQQIGNKLSPMHIPVFLCGFLCGAPYGAAVGFLAPLLRFALFSMPPMPNGISMAFELAAYGLVSGTLYRLLPKKTASLYISLIGAMIAGRIVWGLASCVIFAVQGNAFTMQLFLAGAFFNAVPGIILHLVIIPPIVAALRKAL